MNEKQMREAEVPWLESADDLDAYIKSLVEREHDYGTCVYAMSMAAVAAFQYVAKELGATGFQASCADMDVLRRTRRMPGPFLLINGHDALYPQYDLRGRLDEFLRDAKPWLAEQAEKNLAGDIEHVAPRVLDHWQALARCRGGAS